MFEVVDRQYAGGLAEFLKRQRGEGKSIDEISAQLAADGYEVSSETVRRWCHRAGIPTHRVPAA